MKEVLLDQMKKDNNLNPITATCFDNFTLDGYFDTKREKAFNNNQVNGRLIFSKNYKKLKVNISLIENPTWDTNFLKYVYGKNTQGFYLKLENLSRAKWNIYFNTNIIYCEFNVGTCYISTDPLDHTSGTKMNFSLTNFDSWIPIMEEKKIEPFDRNEKTGVKISIPLPSKKVLGIVDYKGNQVKFYIGTSLSLQSAYQFLINRNNFVRSHTYISVKYSMLTNYEDMLSLVRQFERLFSLIIGKHQMIKFICCFSNNESINVIPRQPYGITHSDDISEHKRYVFSLQSMKLEFGKILNNFLNLDSGLKLLIDNYLMSYSKDFYVPNILTDLCQGIDSFYEGKNNSNYTLESRIKEMLNSLPICLTEVLRENRSVLVDSLIEKMRKGSITDEDFENRNVLNFNDTISVWARIIKDTRVFFVHGNSEKTKFRLDNLIDQTKNIKIFQFLVRCFIFQQLGYTNFKRSQIVNHLKELLQAHYITMN